MTWVKICGMTNLEDALVAVEAGADAVGFVFYEKSPRCVTVEKAREICAKLPERVEKIGVFVGPEEEPIDTFMKARLTGTQTYLSRESIAGSKARTRGIAAPSLPTRARFILAFPMRLFEDRFDQLVQIAAQFAEERKKVKGVPKGIWDTLLLDSGGQHQPGGTGIAFDWKKAQPAAEAMRKGGLRMVVAGGLTPDNVSDAIRALSPWGVDVVSGVEASPGKKDPEKVRAFVRAVREMDRRVG
jgi:phosphoribosylanthranilate isomerase